MDANETLAAIRQLLDQHDADVNDVALPKELRGLGIKVRSDGTWSWQEAAEKLADAAPYGQSQPVAGSLVEGVKGMTHQDRLAMTITYISFLRGNPWPIASISPDVFLMICRGEAVD